MEKSENTVYLNLLKQEVTRLLFTNYHYAVMGAFVIATAIFLELFIPNIHGPILTEKYLLVWYFSVLLILLFRILLLVSYQYIKSFPTFHEIYFNLFAILSFLTAFTFGIIASILMPDDIAYQAFILILVSGLVAGSVQSLSPSYWINVTYMLLTLIPTILWQITKISATNSIYLGTSICMVIFCLFSTIVAKRNYQSQIEKIMLSFENKKMIKNLEYLATHDALTGLFNRTYLNDYLELEIMRSKRKGTHVVIYLIDIDYFKHFNDTYGHEVGDIVLKTVGSFLKKMMRRSDVACRYGGDEFMVILPDITREAALERKKEILKAADRLILRVSDQVIEKIFLSIGSAIFPEDGATLNKIIKSADDAMYAIKKNKSIQH